VSETLRDTETGLYNEVFYTASVPTRVASAKRALRPLSIVVLAVVGMRAEDVAEALRRTVREADLACRLEHGRFGVLLDETAIDGAVRMVERLGAALHTGAGTVQLWAGIAAYPTDALDAVDLLQGADAALREAMASGRSKVQLASHLEPASGVAQARTVTADGSKQ
jgi:predicted signal transduction protein with EAL and GGDEF domain